MTHLQELLVYLAEATHHPQDKIAILLIGGDYAEGKLTYTLRVVFLGFAQQPAVAIAVMGHWLRQHNREAPIKFACDVLDLKTFDLELDVVMTDKAVLSVGGEFHLCPPVPAWLGDEA